MKILNNMVDLNVKLFSKLENKAKEGEITVVHARGITMTFLSCGCQKNEENSDTITIHLCSKHSK
jgi:hypothetical protein